jgi:hypothetical protein
MENALSIVRSRAALINKVVMAHHFSDPQYVVYDDPEYEATLMATPGEDASLLDAAAIMDELETLLGCKVMIVTPDEYESAGDGGDLIPIMGAA